MGVGRICIAAIAFICGAAAPPETSLTAKEKAMLQDSGGAYEEQLSVLALKKSGNPQVHAFAEMDLRDHTALIKQAMQIAGEANEAPQVDLTIEEKQKVASLTLHTGKAFDEAFVQAMSTVNEEDRRSLATSLAAAKAVKLRQFLQHESAIDDDHFKMVQAIHVAY